MFELWLKAGPSFLVVTRPGGGVTHLAGWEVSAGCLGDGFPVLFQVPLQCGLDTVSVLCSFTGILLLPKNLSRPLLPAGSGAGLDVVSSFSSED